MITQNIRLSLVLDVVQVWGFGAYKPIGILEDKIRLKEQQFWLKCASDSQSSEISTHTTAQRRWTAYLSKFHTIKKYFNSYFKRMHRLTHIRKPISK